jgi:hypothetical protein
MNEAPLTRENLVSLAKRAGVSLSPSQVKELGEAFRHIEAMAARVRVRGTPALSAESAMVFAPGVTPR